MQHRRRLQTTPPCQRDVKPALPMIQLPVYRVKQRHLEAYLASVYRMDSFDFLLAAGATPGMCPEYLVTRCCHQQPAPGRRPTASAKATAPAICR